MLTAFVDYFTPFAEDFGAQSLDYWNSLRDIMQPMQHVSQRFQLQLEQIYNANDVTLLKQRVVAASDYFCEQLNELTLLIEGSPVVTDSRTEATDYRERITNLYEQVAEKRHLMANMRNDISIDRKSVV